MSSFCADEVLSVEELVSGVDKAQRVLGGLEIKAFCKSLQRSADLAEMRVRVAALDAETDHHVRWNLLLKKFVTLDPHLKNSSMSVFVRHHPKFSLCSPEQSPVEPFEHFCGIAQESAPPRNSTCRSLACRIPMGSLSDWNALLPSLFIIGSIKAGTTSLWSHLVDATGGAIMPGQLTDKGDISRKEKDFFGDPNTWRRGRHFYDRIWPRCPLRTSPPSITIDATPAYHVWHDAPKNMVTYFGVAPSRRLRFVWMMRDPVDKFWSYFWELKSYNGKMSSMDFGAFLEPKLARVRECQSLDPSTPLWPPSMPPPFANCAPHLDHGLYEPQMRRWLTYFEPSQILLVSFAGYARRPAVVLRDVLRHAGMPSAITAAAVARVRGKGKQNSKACGHGHLLPRYRDALVQLYRPFTERLYSLIGVHAIAVTPCDHQGTRFLDHDGSSHRSDMNCSNSSPSARSTPAFAPSIRRMPTHGTSRSRRVGPTLPRIEVEEALTRLEMIRQKLRRISQSVSSTASTRSRMRTPAPETRTLRLMEIKRQKPRGKPNPLWK